MKKILLAGMVSLGLLVSGNVNAKEPKAEYEWNKYKVSSGDILFELEERVINEETQRNCKLQLGSITLEDRKCDYTIGWIKDKTGTYDRDNGPKQRFDKADKLMKKYRAKFVKFHKEWEKIRWNLDPLNNY